MARRSFLQRAGDAFRRFFMGRAGGSQPVAEPSQPTPTYYEPEPELEPPPPPPPPISPGYDEGSPFDFFSTTRVQYIPRHGMGRRTVIERWTAGNEFDPVQLEDIREMLRQSGPTKFKSIAITGVPTVAYPTKIGEDIITLGYGSINPDMMQYFLNDPDVLDATDWANAMFAGMPIGGQWDVVFQVDILDR